MSIFLVAPVALSILTHIIIALYTSLVAVFSIWTSHRVKLAESAFPNLDDIPSFSTESQSLARRHTEFNSASYLPTRFSVPVIRRTLSLSGASTGGLTAQSSPELRPQSMPGSPVLSFPFPLDSQLHPSPPMTTNDYSTLLQEKNDYWLNEEDLSDEHDLLPTETPNSPTGSISGKLSGEWFWSREDDMLASQKRSGRVILCSLAAFRAISPLPAVLMHLKAGNTNPNTYAQTFNTGFDLVILDGIVSLGLALFPLSLFLSRMNFSLPSSFEHHQYYCSAILLVLPLFASMQLPLTTTISLYRMMSPILSAVMLLIARDQATADFWSAMNRKARWTFSQKA